MFSKNNSHQNPPFACLCLQLQWAPEGYHSVCGTESDQKVPIVKFYAAKGDRMAQALLAKGDVYGKQFVTFESNQAYPAYVVTYNYHTNLPPNAFMPSSPRINAFKGVRCYRCWAYLTRSHQPHREL